MPNYSSSLTNWLQLFCLADVVAHMLNRGIYHQTVATIIAFELQDAFPLSAIATCVIERVGRTKDQDSQEQHHLPGSVPLSFITLSAYYHIFLLLMHIFNYCYMMCYFQYSTPAICTLHYQ